MKILFDFLPIAAVLLACSSYAESQQGDWAAATGEHEWLGFMVAGRRRRYAAEAPVLLATVVVIVATMAQIAMAEGALGKKHRHHAVGEHALGLVTVLGGLPRFISTAKRFIKWKPTVLYWVMGGGPR